MSTSLRISIATTVTCYVLYRLAKVLYQELTSPLRNLPGPSGAHPILGHFKQLNNDSTLTQQWRDKFGPNFQYRAILYQRALYTSDTTALNHILMKDHLYQKGPIERNSLKNLLGNGLLVVETDEHRRQRKILNPAFGVVQIRELTDIFSQKSAQLRDIWAQQIMEDGSPEIEVLGWLRRTTLDVIGQAGFNYECRALEPGTQANELVHVLRNLLHSSQSQIETAIRLIQALIPALNIIPTRVGKITNAARNKMFEIGSQLLTDSKAITKVDGGTGRDLLSIMVKANMAEDLPDNQRLSDADVIAQVPTFLLAGHETTSAATAWALHALSMHPSVQTQLRNELMSVPTASPTVDLLSAESLPYLERVVREVMRVHSPVAFTFRTAMEDDVLPLAKPFVNTRGKLCDSIPVRKGTILRIPIAGVHLEKDIWGEDAAEFRPDRWAEIPDAVKEIPGVWGNLLTFLAGPHNCIGFRFALVEMKVLLFTLVRAFEFEPAVQEGEIMASATAVQRPKLRSERKQGGKLPMIVRPVGVPS
ncbi:cytochrome P450 [Mycena vulgaris]|nr:cytochrome P450 [Mycena vulgaris]